MKNLLKKEMKMKLICNCVICDKKIKNPKIEQVTCGNEECIKTYAAYLMWRSRNRKDYKPQDIKDFNTK